MNQAVLLDIEHNKRRLEYYNQLKQRQASSKSTSVDKWIEIYSDRVKKLEKQAVKLGLKTQLAPASDKASASA